MIDIAADVLRWQADGRPCAVARTVSVTGISSRWPAEALAATDSEVVGSLLGGAADDQLLPVLREVGGPGSGPGPGTARLVDVVVGDAEAVAAGLACGGTAQVLVQPCPSLPARAWEALAAREPVCLVTPLDDGGTATEVVDASVLHDRDASLAPEVRQVFGQGTSQTTALVLSDGRRVLVTASWPPCRLLVLGEGDLAAALDGVAGLLGWRVQAVADTAVPAALDAVRTLGRGDALLVLSHDIGASSRVLAAGLAQGVGYVGALGSRHTQARRREWLTGHGVEDASVDTVRGPAGLDVGARTPAEIAVAVVAEVLAVRSGASAVPLRDRPGPVH